MAGSRALRRRSLTMSRKYFLAAAFLAALSEMALPATAQENAGYHVRAEYKLEGSGSMGNLWVDSAARRLYVAHADRVEVLNADTGSHEGSMPAQDAASVLMAAGTGHGFFSNRASGSVTMFDPASLNVTRTIPTGAKEPESLVFDPDADRVFVIAPGSAEVVALDARTGDVAGRVLLQGHLRGAATNGMGSLFVAAEDLNAIHVVDTHTLKFLGDFPSGDAQGPVSLAIDPAGRRLFAACADGKLAIIDTDIGFTFQELPIAAGAAASVFTFTPQGKGGWKGADFVTGDAGAMTLIQMNAFIRYSVGGSVSIPKGIHALAYDPRTHRIYLSVSAPQPEVLALAPESSEVTQ